MKMKRSHKKTVSTIAKVGAGLLLFVPVFRLGQVAYRLLSQGPSAALGEMARGTKGFSENLALTPWSGVVLEFGFVMLLYAGLGLALLWMARRVASDGDLHNQEATRRSP